MIKLKPEEIYSEYVRAKQYNASIDLDERVKSYENFFLGKQWEGLNAPNIDKPVFNILKRVTNYFIAMLASDSIGINIRLFNSVNDEKERCMIEALREQILMVMEDNKYPQLTRRMLRDAAVDGDGCVHLYYEPPQACERGRIACELINNTDIFFANPYDQDISRQPYVIIASMRDVEEVMREMRDNGAADEIIEEAFYDDIFASDGGQAMKRCCVLTKYYRKEGKVWFTRTVKNAVVKPPTCMGIKSYPICYMNWERVKGSYHGMGVIEGLIPNQIAINKMAAMAQQFIKQQAFPKVIYNRNKIKSWVGGITPIGVSGDPGDIIYTDRHDKSMSGQVSEYIDKFISHTKDLMGASDAALGNISPDNTSAIIAVQKATAVPLELIRQEYYNFTEDFIRITIELMSAYYGRRMVAVDEADGCIERLVDFSRFDAGRMKLDIDIGQASYFSEITATTTLDNLYKSGLIDAVDYLEGIPRNAVPNKKKLIEEAIRRKESAQHEREEE